MRPTRCGRSQLAPVVAPALTKAPVARFHRASSRRGAKFPSTSANAAADESEVVATHPPAAAVAAAEAARAGRHPWRQPRHPREHALPRRGQLERRRPSRLRTSVGRCAEPTSSTRTRPVRTPANGLSTGGGVISAGPHGSHPIEAPVSVLNNVTYSRNPRIPMQRRQIEQQQSVQQCGGRCDCVW